MNALTDLATPTPAAQILLIDLENCPSEINDLLTRLGEYTQIVICYAQSGAKVPLDWLAPLSQALTSQRLQIRKMACAGKNAADFGLAFHAGMLVQQFPADTGFTILSNDTDLDHVVQLLDSTGRQARRIGRHHPSPGTDTTPPPPVPASPPAATPAAVTTERTLATFCKMLREHPNNRPGKEDALRNSLRAHFGQSRERADDGLTRLLAQGAVRITEGKVTYAESKLIAVALALTS
jgi:hypothetical protein